MIIETQGQSEKYTADGYEPVDEERLEKILKSEKQLQKEQKKRRRWAKDLLSTISDGMEISMKVLLAKIGIDLPKEEKK